ncbi:MAG: hypothetical protein RLZZ306_502, partial [Bacteroidota bacterium]
MKNKIYKLKLSLLITLMSGFLLSCGDLKVQELFVFQPGIP